MIDLFVKSFLDLIDFISWGILFHNTGPVVVIKLPLYRVLKTGVIFLVSVIKCLLLELEGVVFELYLVYNLVDNGCLCPIKISLGCSILNLISLEV